MAVAPAIIEQPASFRDPSGKVFEFDGRILRAIDIQCLTTLRELESVGLLQRWIDSGRIVPTEFVEDEETLSELHSAYPAAAGFLEHARIERISYPYEWSPSMLASAGLATLELQMELIGHGYSLKDATAYNIQFVSGKPIFIDLPSIERADRLDIWPALGQFNRMFTLPLLLHQRKGMSLRSCFLAHLDGMDVDEARRGFGLLELIRPDLLLDLTLPYLLGRRTKNKDYWRTADKTRIARSRRHFVSGRIENGKWRIETAASPGRRPAKESPGRDAQARTGETPVPHTLDAQRLNLQRLHRKLRKLASRYRPAGTWADYTRTCSYNDRADASKQSLVNAFFAEYPPSSVLDVGCNTGTYSKLAAEAGARVLAIDSDPASVDLLFRDVGEQQNPILPLCVDLANPSPGIGFRNRERSPFLERCRSECVLALAVIHHLHVSANLPLTEIRDLFADIAEEYLVLEFVPRDDVMFQQLIRFRADLYDGFTLENCITCFSEQFELIRQAVIADSPRTLLFWRKRGY